MSNYIKPVYLSGPIQGRTFAEHTVWREWAADFLSPLQPTLNPLRHPFSYEETPPRMIVETDITDIRASRAILVMFDKPSVGTVMEIRIAAAEVKIPIYTVDVSGNQRSPWLIYHTTRFFDTLQDACEVLLDEARRGSG
jgi:hypothetical protein